MCQEYVRVLLDNWKNTHLKIHLLLKMVIFQLAMLVYWNVSILEAMKCVFLVCGLSLGM